MRTNLAVLHGGIGLLTVLAIGYCVDSLNTQFAVNENIVLFNRPIPTVYKILGNDGRDLADLESDRVNMLNIILNGNLFNVVDNIEYYAEFVHILPLSAYPYPYR